MSSARDNEETIKKPDDSYHLPFHRPVNITLKAKYAFYSTLIFMLVANPETYKLTQRVLGKFISIASDTGCATANGFFFHTALFFLILWGFMLFPRDS